MQGGISNQMRCNLSGAFTDTQNTLENEQIGFLKHQL